jgi:hypothetical protein
MIIQHFDSLIDISLIAFLDISNLLAVDRIYGFECFAADRVAPLIANEDLKKRRNKKTPTKFYDNFNPPPECRANHFFPRLAAELEPKNDEQYAEWRREQLSEGVDSSCGSRSEIPL